MKVPEALRRLAQTTEETLPRLSPFAVGRSTEETSQPLSPFAWPFVIVGGALALTMAIPVVVCLGIVAAFVLGAVGGAAFTLYVVRIVVNDALKFFAQLDTVPERDDLEAAEGKGDDKVVVIEVAGGESERGRDEEVAKGRPQPPELGQNEYGAAGVIGPDLNELGQAKDGPVGHIQLDVHALSQRGDNTLQNNRQDLNELGQADVVKAASSRYHAEELEAPSRAHVDVLSKNKSNPPTAPREHLSLLPN